MLDVNKFSEVVEMDFDYDDMNPKEVYEEKKRLIIRDAMINFRKEHKRLYTFLNILCIIIISPLLLLTLLLEILGVVGDKIDQFTVDFRNFIWHKVAISKFKKKYGIK